MSLFYFDAEASLREGIFAQDHETSTEPDHLYTLEAGQNQGPGRILSQPLFGIWRVE